MKRISVTGWVPKDEKETETLRRCFLFTDDLRVGINGGLVTNKKNWKYGPLKKIRVTVEVDVEVLP